MNSTFKVVFNKARGALMVVNEVTSSVQAKGTKTVVAAAVATMIAGVAGTAMAAEWVEAPKDAATAAPSDWKFDKNAYLFSETNDGKDPTAFLGASEKGKTFTFDKKLWVKAGSDATRATGLWAADGATIENTGTIYVTGGSSWQNHAMGAANGAKAINAGTIVAKNAYGMFIGTSKNGTETPTIQNDGRIVVEGQGAGFELGGAGVKGIGINNGTITVGEVFDKNKGKDEWAHGVLINTATNTFENNGTINATAEGTSAIEVKDGATTTTLNFGEKSDVNGLIHLAAGTVNMTFNGTQDELTIKTEQQANYGNSSNPTSCAPLAVNLTLDKGANITLADRQGSTYESVNIADGKLTASIWHDTNEYGEKKEQLQNDNKFKNVTVGEKGVFNITKLNSGGDKDQTKTNAKPHNTLLIKDMKLTLDGGALQVAGQNYTGALKVGMSSENGADTLTINAGNYNFESLKVGNASNNVVTVAGGSLTVGDVEITGKRHGKLALTGGTTSINGSFTTVQGAIELNGGTLVTSGANLFAKGEEADAEYATTDAWKHVTATKGVVELTDTGFEYSLADLKKGQKLLKNDGSVKLVLNGTFKLGKNENLNADSVSNLVLADQTGTASDSVTEAFKVTAATTLGALDFTAVTESETNKNADSIALGNGTNTLTLAGNGGDVFKNLGAKVTKITTGDLVLGTAGNSGNVNVDTLKTDALTVAGDFSARAVEVTSAQIDGMLTADSLAVANNGKAVVAGTLALTGNVKETASELSGNVELDEGSVLTTNVAAAKAIAGEFDESTAIIYVDRQLKLNDATIGPKTVVQNRALLTAAAPARAESTVTVADGMALVIDASAFTQSAGHDFTKADVSALGNNTTVNLTGGDLELVNVNKLGELDIGKALSGATASNVDTDSIYVFATPDNAKPDIVTLAYNKGLVADATVDARLENAFTNGVGAKELGILSALDTPAFYDEETDKLTAAGNKALEQATGGNATAGVLNVAYDANAQVTDAIVRHQLSEHAGMGVWADVFYAKNEAKEIYGDFGYSADIYGGVLGFDYTAACGGTLGAALTVGTADADSEGGVLSTSLSSDFVGLSVYASKDFSGLNVKADLGYIDFSNDFTGLGDASDATTITFGVRGDFTAYQNGAFSVVPHMGLRYTRIDTDAVAFNDEQNMNVLEAPIGVKFAGTFEATGWKLVPSYDFTIVPQLGDKEVEAFGTAGDITILSGGLFNNVLGVEAVKDNMSFGLNASYGFGPDDRANTQVNANFRYHF